MKIVYVLRTALLVSHERTLHPSSPHFRLVFPILNYASKLRALNQREVLLVIVVIAAAAAAKILH
jgi:hypothetical protein